MMSFLRHTRALLLDPRGSQSHQRSRRSGVAMLVVMVTLAILTVLVTELIYTASVRHAVSRHRQERSQALWLAHSGFNIYRLLLIADQSIGEQLGEQLESLGVYMGSTSLLDSLPPALDTSFMRLALSGLMTNVEAPEDLEAAVTEYQSDGDLEAAQRFSDRDFLTFVGDFNVSSVDHESRLNINAFASETTNNVQETVTGQTLYALMSGMDEDQWFFEHNLDRWEIIANLKDWVDDDTFRSGLLGGYEDDLYNNLDDPYLSKNAPFDTMAEIRLVDSWQDILYERYADQLTVYGNPDGKINVTTAGDPLIRGIIRACAETLPTDSTVDTCMNEIQQDPFSGAWNSAAAFAGDILGKCGVELDNSCVTARVTTTSKTYTVTSVGLVGTTEITITAVLDFNDEATGELRYWRID